MKDTEPVQLALRSLCCERLADGIGEDWKNWTKLQGLNAAAHVFIESPVGTGKAAFLAGTLFPGAAGLGRGALYLGSHASCRRMAEQLRAHGFADAAAPQGAQSFRLPGQDACVTLAEHAALMSLTKKDLPPVYYVVVDEAHFFLEDALFNPRTGLLLERLAEHWRDCALVFLSTALGEEANVLAGALARCQRGFARSLPLTVPQPLFYRNLFCCGTYALRFHERQEALLAQLRQAPAEEKWLVFVSSRQTGERLARALGAPLLTAEKKNGALWRGIAESARFSERVLITTRLPDGVCIDDPAVRHLVLPFCTRSELLQMLGRVRLHEGETVTLHAALPTVQAVNAQAHRAEEMRAAMERVLAAQETRYYAAPSGDVQTRLLQEYWLAGRQHINALFYIGDERVLCPNRLAYEKLGQLQQFYAQLRGGDPARYPNLVLQWLQQAGQNVSCPDGQDDALEAFLRRHVDSPIPEQAQEGFYQDFQQRFKADCYARCADDPQRLRALLGIRKGKTQRKASMNRALAALGLGFEVKKENNCWVVRQRA